MSYIYVILGDLAQLAADAVVFSTSQAFGATGKLYPAFAKTFPGFSAQYQDLKTHAHKYMAGTSCWLPLESSSRPAGIVVTITVGGGMPLPEAARLAVRSAIQTAAQHLPPVSGRRRLLALPTFLAGGGGGKKQMRELAQVQLETARAAGTQALPAAPGGERWARRAVCSGGGLGAQGAPLALRGA